MCQCKTEVADNEEDRDRNDIVDEILLGSQGGTCEKRIIYAVLNSGAY